MRRMSICATGDPDRLQPRVVEHIVVFVVNSNVEIAVLLVLFGPFNFGRLRAAYSYNLRVRNSVKQCVNMSLSLCRIDLL